MRALEGVDPSVAALAAYGLGTKRAIPSSVLAEDSFDLLVEAARRHRVLGILAAAVADGAFPVSDSQRERLADEEQRWAAHAVRVERLVLRTADTLEQAGLPYRVFKGPALAHVAYPTPRWRIFADLDLLVPSGAFRRAHQAIIDELDAEQPTPELIPGFDAEFGKEALLVAEGLEIDLHRTFVTGPVGLTIPLDELFEDQATFTLGGRTLPTLAPVPTFLQACINAAVGDFPVRLCSLRDVVQLSPKAPAEVSAITATAERWGIGLVVKRAVDLAWDGLGLDPGPFSEWAGTYHSGVKERLCVRSYLTPARSYTRPVASLLVIPGARARARYLRALLFPQRSYLASRGWRLRSHAHRALTALRRR